MKFGRRKDADGMKLEFSGIAETVLPHFNHGEKELRAKMFRDEKVKILLGRLEPGASIGLHTHEMDSEITYILQGRGKVLYDGTWEEVGPGMCHYCPKGHTHSLINDGGEDLVFFAVVPEHA